MSATREQYGITLISQSANNRSSRKYKQTLIHYILDNFFSQKILQMYYTGYEVYDGRSTMMICSPKLVTNTGDSFDKIISVNNSYQETVGLKVYHIIVFKIRNQY